MIDKYTVSSVKIFYKKLTFQFHIENRVCLIDIRKCFMLYDFEKRAVFIENNFLLRSLQRSNHWKVIVRMVTSYIIL